MLAYVFWHWRISEIDAPAYQTCLVNFHRMLAAHKPNGFRHTRVLLMEQAPWLERNEETYEDWHIVENSAALDPLNEHAVNGPCQEPHRQVARWTEGASGGLYQLLFGNTDLATIRFAYRFAKPAGMTYDALYALLRPFKDGAKGNLWRRQMNLGPGLEFCFHSAEALALPDMLHVIEVPVKQICFTGHR